MEKSPQTAANVRDVLRLVLGHLVDEEVLDTNPAAGVTAPSAGRGAIRFLEPEEADQLQSVADAHEHPCIGPLVALAVETGLRLGEMQALRWGRDGLDLERRQVTVSATRDQGGGLVVPKSGRPRVVPLSDDLARRLRRYRLASPSSQDGDTVFWRHHRRAWEQVRVAAGLAGLRVHDLRHTAATFWLAAGLSVHAVGELLGHTDAALVLRLYGHALPQEVAKAGERMSAWRAEQRASGKRGRP